MRAISFVNRLEFDFTGNVLRKGLTLGDVDNDGNNELVVGGENGEVAIFKGSKKWLTLTGLNYISCVAVGDIFNENRNSLVIVTSDGWCYIYDCVSEPVPASESSESQPEEKIDEGVEQVDEAVFSNESLESDKSTSSESGANSSLEKERMVLKRIHKQRIPANSKDILLADIDGDGSVEMVLGLSDRVVRSYRWSIVPEEDRPANSSNQPTDPNQKQEAASEDPPKKLIGLHKWESAKQIGSVSLHYTKDGAASLLVAQPGGTFMRIVCQSEEAVVRSLEAAAAHSDSGSFQSDSLVGSKIDYQFLGISRMRNQNISTEIVGNLRTRAYFEQQSSESDSSDMTSSVSSHSTRSSDTNSSKYRINSKCSPYALATLDGTIMLVQNEIILWAIAVDHQIFALTKLDVTGNGCDDIIACCWDGQTYILDQDKNSVRFHLDESVQAFECGYYSLTGDSPPVTCFVYVTFRNKIYLYYDIPLKVMICKKFEPDMTKLRGVLRDEYAEEGKLDKKSKRELIEYLLYGGRS